MNNPRNNLTTDERARIPDGDRIYIYAATLNGAYFWFRDPSDRDDFVDLFNRVREGQAARV